MLDELTFTIEQADWKDLGVLRQLEKACFGKDAWPLLDLVAVLTLPGVVRIKAVVEDQMVGFISGERRVREQSGWITTICVDDHYRRRGIARGLLEACERELQMKRVRLSVRRSNFSALRLYEKVGYRPHSVWPKYYSDGEDALVLEKKLTF